MDAEIIRGIARVVIVLVIFVPLIYFFTRWYGSLHGRNSSILVKEKLSLGGNKSLYVIEWEGEQFLLAVSSQQINLITTKSPSQIDDTRKVESNDSHPIE